MRRFAKDNLDDLRRALMWEPRGHADMYGCIVVPPVTPHADLGVLFTHNEGYSTMCGHGIIGVSTVAVEMGLVEVHEPQTRIGIDTPAGFVDATVRVEAGRARSVTFVNVPSFVQDLDLEVDVPEMGRIRYDLAFGGAFYAYVDAAEAGVDLSPSGYRGLIQKGRAIKKAVQAASPPVHPDDDDLSFLYGTIFVGPPADAAHHSRNVCVFADGEVDRSPTGTGVSGRVAIHHARGEVSQGETIEIESILGTTFTARVMEETAFGPYAAVVPEVGGRAHITGRNELWIDPEDALAGGFFLR
jgi:trans-L-3-hydroxyproline dehydratase